MKDVLRQLFVPLCWCHTKP